MVLDAGAAFHPCGDGDRGNFYAGNGGRPVQQLDLLMGGQPDGSVVVIQGNILKLESVVLDRLCQTASVVLLDLPLGFGSPVVIKTVQLNICRKAGCVLYRAEDISVDLHHIADTVVGGVVILQLCQSPAPS